MTAALTLAPMSPNVAKLWHQLQAAMLKETHGLDVTPAGAIVLPPPPARVSFDERLGNTILQIGDGENHDKFTKRWAMPVGWEEFWDQAHWRLNRLRTDSNGESWSTAGGPYVVDDFGDLVKVPE